MNGSAHFNCRKVAKGTQENEGVFWRRQEVVSHAEGKQSPDNNTGWGKQAAGTYCRDQGVLAATVKWQIRCHTAPTLSLGHKVITVQSSTCHLFCRSWVWLIGKAGLGSSSKKRAETGVFLYTLWLVLWALISHVPCMGHRKCALSSFRIVRAVLVKDTQNFNLY